MFPILADTTDLFDISQSSVYDLGWRAAGGMFLQVAGISFLICLLVGWLYSCIFLYQSFAVGTVKAVKGLFEGLYDVVMLPFGISRVFAIAGVTIRESIRRKILYIFVLFLLPFLFVGWYLPNSDEGQLVTLVAFVNTAISWLVIVPAIFLTAMNFPNDIQTRVIQTIATKPIRRLELLVGRIVGFMAIFTLMILVMGSISLIFIRQQVTPTVYEQQWKARQPMFGAWRQGPNNTPLPPLVFFRDGKLSAGVHVGREFDVRKHIGGATGDYALYYFYFNPESFTKSGRETIPMECRFDIYKTNKGNPTHTDASGKVADDSGIFANITFYNDAEMKSMAYQKYLRVNNFRITAFDVPVEVFKSGTIFVKIECLTPSQFLGMYDLDVYFLQENHSFVLNFWKGMFSLWLKILLIVTISVSASTVLKGFITVLLAIMVLVVGANHGFLIGVLKDEVKGGGPIESFVRLINQNNQVSELDATLSNRVLLGADDLLKRLMYAVWHVIPNLSSLDTMQFVAEGFSIENPYLIRNTILVAAYVLPVIFAGHYLLRNRELAV